MKYLVSPEIFALDSRLRFGIIIGKDIRNRLSTSEDELRLSKAEESVRARYS